MLWLFTFLLLTLAYGLLIGSFKRGWKELPTGSLANSIPWEEFPTVSVIIPARNEEKNIGQLLEALRQQDFPAEKLEIIVVDDHSEDQTAAIARSFLNVRVLPFREEGLNSYKKKALEKAVAAACGELIVCTDADCIPTKEWLS